MVILDSSISKPEYFVIALFIILGIAIITAIVMLINSISETVKEKRSIIFSREVSSKRELDRASFINFMNNLSEEEIQIVEEISKSGFISQNGKKIKRITFEYFFNSINGTRILVPIGPVSGIFGGDSVKRRISFLGIKEIRELYAIAYKNRSRIKTTKIESKELSVSNLSSRNFKDVPMLFCYEILNSEQQTGLIKIETEDSEIFEKFYEGLNSSRNENIKCRIAFFFPAITINNRFITKEKIFEVFRKAGIENPFENWFKCSPVKALQIIEFIKKEKV